MNETKVPLEVEMINSMGCSLGVLTLEEVAKMLAKGDVEPGDTFKVFQPE